MPDSKAGLKLQRIIKHFRQNLFVFLTDRAVSPTNNGSERALRPCVVFRKMRNVVLRDQTRPSSRQLDCESVDVVRRV